ncbi:MAG TPA: hypothetical protein VMG35_05280 [Bryobacteraceae bacterium]|nr:hypothetical protein [Bryobacteraceae bacterium]
MAGTVSSNLSLPERALFWKPWRIVAGVLTSIAAVAGLIANVGAVTDFMQPSVSGPWLLTLSIQHSSVKRFEGTTAAFQVYLDQDGHRVTGKGEKVKVNDQRIPRGQHQLLSLRGTVSGDVVTMEYGESNGDSRQTVGEFTLKIRREGKLSRQTSRMEGSFSGTAASTSGTAVAVRQTQ